jgi:hypothetical protein
MSIAIQDHVVSSFWPWLAALRPRRQLEPPTSQEVVTMGNADDALFSRAEGVFR